MQFTLTPDGEVIRAHYDAMTGKLVTVRASQNGWTVTLIDTHNDVVCRRVTYGSRLRAEEAAKEMALS